MIPRATDTVLLSQLVAAPAGRVFSVWQTQYGPGAFDGQVAATVELQPNCRVVQTWRINEFPSDSPDSRLELRFEETARGTLVTLLHTGLPFGQADWYRERWLKFCLLPLQKHFA